jgi:leucyl/phenylalanyl-tRNA--protein transferase
MTSRWGYRDRVPIEPPPNRWRFPPATAAGPDDIVAVGADLEPGTILAAYQSGMFPMPVDPDGPIAWWSPDPRGVLPLDGLRVTRSLRKSTNRYTTTIDQDFGAVIRACAEPERPHGWISPEIIEAYEHLHDLGWTHSIETWSDEGELVGGLYGVAIGGFFAGESMFHRRTDASKVALVRLVDELRTGGATLLDVQWATDHLASLGVVEVDRREYLRLLKDALDLPLPGLWT